MSLFPAYSGPSDGNASAKDRTDKDKTTQEWLANSSFEAGVLQRGPIIIISSDSSSDESVEILPPSEIETPTHSIVHLDSDTSTDESYKRSKRSKKRKKSKKRFKGGAKLGDKIKYEREVEDVYFEDKRRDRLIYNVTTLCARARPRYDRTNASLGFVPFKQPAKKVFQRYYVTNIDAYEKSKKKDGTIRRDSKRDVNTSDKDETEIPNWCTNLEDVQKKRTKEFNEKLFECPDDVQLWIQYIHFQDVFTKFHRGPVLKNSRAMICQRKLSIADKALEKNPESRELLELKLSIMEELSPADQFSSDVESLVNKDSGNILLWQTLIMTTQASLAMCTVPKVLNLYSKCLCTLRQRSRTNPHSYDERILEMLYQCLTFLRHAGLWEQMWETLRLNLSLNLSLSRNSLLLQGSIDEKKLIGMEEVILTSRLPLNQLWLRVESLRENCHWISVCRDQLELVGDSRRFVLPEDVADYVHPMASNDSSFRLAIYCLLSLKIPLLPTRDCILKDLGIKKFNWSADSSEVLLPMIYPAEGVMAGHKQRFAMLEGILDGRLTSGPQYLRFHPAQEPYLDFIRDVFRIIAENLSSSRVQRTSVYVWWLRFERLLVSLNRDDPLKNENRSKKLKVILKEFLKKEGNRNDPHFYREFALIEREAGRFDSCVNVLQTTISSQENCLAAIASVEERAALFSLYRALFECFLDTRTYQEFHVDEILKAASLMVPAMPSETSLERVEEFFRDTVEEFSKEPPPEEAEDAYFFPNLECDAITCYAYFLYARKRDTSDILRLFDDYLEHCSRNRYLQERLYESKIAFLQLCSEQTQHLRSALKESLQRSLNSYPDNFYLLSVFAGIESKLPSWQLASRTENIRTWRAIALCLAGRMRINALKKLGLFDSACAAINKLLSYHRFLARMPETRRCPLIWRLYMLLLREENLCEKKGEEVYHESVAQCPWARGIYTDAAEVAPQLLTQIQDLIQEKELRMHVTPEELDILRG